LFFARLTIRVIPFTPTITTSSPASIVELDVACELIIKVVEINDAGIEKGVSFQ
jgi:hypothetical protein